MSVINTNVSALYSQNAMKTNARSMSTVMEQLSTGNRVNSAKDDAAGLAIGQNMTSQIRGLNQAVRNLNDGINMLQTAEGAMIEQSNMLQRMRELAVQAMNGTYSNVQRGYLDKEFQALSTQIGKIASDTKWNDQTLLDASQTQNGTAGTFKYQAGQSDGQTVVVTINAMTLSGLGMDTNTAFAYAAVSAGGTDVYGNTTVSAISAATTAKPDIGTASRASSTLTLVGAALETINSQRAQLGAAINRMEFAADNLTNISANTTQSRSTIMDTDYALATTQLAKTQIIQQAATAMLAQANQQPQGVMALLKG
jgi:flagellin